MTTEWWEDEELIQHFDVMASDIDGHLSVVMPLLKHHATPSNEWVLLFAAAAGIHHYTDARFAGFTIHESFHLALSQVMSRPSIRQVVEEAAKMGINSIGGSEE
jgi:hypothetical protein